MVEPTYSFSRPLECLPLTKKDYSLDLGNLSFEFITLGLVEAYLSGGSGSLYSDWEVSIHSIVNVVTVLLIANCIVSVAILKYKSNSNKF